MKKRLLFFSFPLFLLVSCKNEAIIIGQKQKDEKCNPTTGYQWSSLKKECIRVFEQQIQLKSVAKIPMETICAVIFNETNDQAEVFAATTVILAKISVDNFEGTVSSKKYILKKNNEQWQLIIDSILVYTE